MNCCEDTLSHELLGLILGVSIRLALETEYLNSNYNKEKITLMFIGQLVIYFLAGKVSLLYFLPWLLIPVKRKRTIVMVDDDDQTFRGNRGEY